MSKQSDILYDVKKSYPPDILEFMKQQLEEGRYVSEDALLEKAVRVLRVVGDHNYNLYKDIQEGLRSPSEPWNIEDMKKELADQLDMAA